MWKREEMTALHINTPLIESLSICKEKASKIWLKMETMQPCGSFKARGIGFTCHKYITDGASALLSSSGGNAGLAVAYSGRRLGAPVTVVVPKTTKKRAIDLIKLEGADVIITGDNWDEAHMHAMSLVKNKVAYIHPFDDPNIWEGHASIIDEIADADIAPDAIVLSVGGGGLLCGVVEGLRRNHWEDVPILAVETQGADSLSVASLANAHIGIDKISSIATSLGAKKVAKRAFELLNEHPITCHIVTDAEALNGCYRFLNDHRALVEPACGASLSAVYDGCDFLKDKHNILVIVCGGVGVTIGQLEKWMQEFTESSYVNEKDRE
jgi:L-serine/L-threonine ammonia-lyase